MHSTRNSGYGRRILQGAMVFLACVACGVLVPDGAFAADPVAGSPDAPVLDYSGAVWGTNTTGSNSGGTIQPVTSAGATPQAPVYDYSGAAWGTDGAASTNPIPDYSGAAWGGNTGNTTAAGSTGDVQVYDDWGSSATLAGSGSTGSGSGVPSGNGLSQPIKDTISTLGKKQEVSFGCFDSKITNTTLVGCLAFASYWVMTVTAALAGWASVAMNFTIMELVVGMGSLVGGMTGVITAWEVLRNLANVFLVFLTVFIGIATILGVSGYGYKQLLWKVILAALFVNFSITFAKVIIDISNLAAMETYGMLLKQGVADNQANAVCIQPLEAQGTNLENNDCITRGVAGVFWDKLEITEIFNIDKIKKQDSSNAPDFRWQMVYIGLLGALLFLVMAFVFGATAFLLITRFIILVFLIIVSPVALVAWITGVSGQGNRWWHTLLNQAMFAPFMFLMFWIAYQVMVGTSARYKITGEAGLVGAAVFQMSGVGILTFFFITMGLIIGALIIARELGAHGASAIIKTGQNWSRKAGFGMGAVAGAATFGLAARAGRTVIGGGANAAAESRALAEMEAKGGIRGWMATKTRKGLTKVSSNSMDIRNAPVVGGTLSKYGGKAGGKGGYKAAAAARDKELTEIHKRMGEKRASAEQRNAREDEVRGVDADHKELTDGAAPNAEQRMVQQYNITADEYTKRQQLVAESMTNHTQAEKRYNDLKSSGSATAEQLAEAEQNVKSAEQEYYNNLNSAEELRVRHENEEKTVRAMSERNKAERQLASGTVESVDPTTRKVTARTITEAERRQAQTTINESNTTIRSNYGLVGDPQIRTMENRIRAARERGDTKEADRLVEQRERMVMMKEAKDADERIGRLGNVEMHTKAREDMLRMKDLMDQDRKTEHERIAKKWDKTLGDEAKERQSNYVTNLESKGGRAARKTAEKLRASRGKSEEEQLNDKIMELIKKRARETKDVEGEEKSGEPESK